MKRSFSRFSLGCLRILTARDKTKRSMARLNLRSPLALILISLAAAAVLLTFVASASKRASSGASLSTAINNGQDAHAANAKIKTAPGLNLLSPAIVNITAVKSHAAGPFHLGDIITYSTTISDTGADALNVNFSDTPDANTTFVGGSVAASPVAVNDTYPQTVIGNVSIDSASIPYSVTTNDFLGLNPTATITAFDATSANGGNVTMTTSGAGMGQFTYNPPPGFEGTDTFTYTLTDNANATIAAANRTATVSITVSGMVWFINNNAAACTTLASGCGRLSHPFSSLAAFNTLNNGAGNNPAVNDNIFIFESATSYTGGVTLLSSQKLIGQDSTSTLAAITGLTPPSGSSTFPAMNTGGNATTIVNAAGNGVTLNSGNTLNGFTAGAATGIAISGSGFGTLTVADVIVNTTGQGLSLTNGTLAATFASVTSSAGTNNIALATGGTTLAGTLTINGGALSNATSDSFVVSGTGTSTATISDSGTIASGSTHSVNIANKSGGTVTFSGAVTDTDTGITLTNNTGATITFSGGISASTGGNTAFVATGGGTVSATQNNTTIVNTLTTTTATTALNVANTTIGASGLTFRSIAAGTGAGSAGDGIILDTTGSSGGLTITGNGGAGTGGTIQHKTGADGSTTQGIGIYLNSTSNVSLSWMQLNDFDNFAIRGTSVSGLTMNNVVTTGTNGNNGGIDEGTVAFGWTTAVDSNPGLTGSVSITNCNFGGGSVEDTFRVRNGSGSLNRITMTNDTFACLNTTGDALKFETGTTGVINATVQNSFFTSAAGDLFNFLVNGTAADDLVFTGNTLTNNNPLIATGGGGVTISGNGTSGGNLTYNISNNSMRDSDGHAILIVKSTGPATFSGTFSGNTIGVAAVADSGSKAGSGIKVQNAGQGSMTIAVTGNVIRQYNNFGIELETGGGATAQSGNLDATVTGNTVSNPGTGGLPMNGIHLNGGTVPLDTYSICANIGGAGALANTITGSGLNGGTDVRVRQRQSTTVKLPGYGGANTDDTAVQTYLSGRNGAGTALASHNAPPGGGFIGGGACVTAFAMYRPEESRRDYLAQNNGGSSSSSLKQVLHPVAAFAAKLSFLNNLDTLVTPTVMAAEMNRNGGVDDASSTSSTSYMPMFAPVSVNVGTLPAGKSVIIKFQVTVNNPLTSPSTATSVANTGQVTGTNFGLVNSNTDTAQLCVPTVTTTPLANQTVAQGATATFTTKLTGSAPFTFVWKKGVNPLTSGVSLGGRATITTNTVGSDTTSTLQITGTILSDSDTYTADGTNLAACGDPATNQSATLTVVQPPTISKAFLPVQIPLNGTSTLTFTIANPNASSLTGVSFSDSLPAGVQVAGTPNVSNTCNGSVTATAGTGTISLSGGTVAASPATCTLSVDVTGTTAGVKSNTTGNISSTEGGTGTTSNTATLTVVAPPTLSKAFGAATIPLNGTTTLTFTVTNPNGTVGLSGVGFSDTLPAGLQVASTPNVSNTCGGTFTPAAGNTTLTFSGGSVLAGGSCTVAVDITGTTAGVKSNTSGTISSTEGGAGTTSNTALLTVVAPPVIGKAFNPPNTTAGGNSTLTFTINNPNSTTGLTGVSFTDTLPAGIKVAAAPNVVGACGGTVTATANTDTISLSNGAIALSGSCTISVEVTATTGGTNCVQVASTNGGTGNTGCDTLTTCLVPPANMIAWWPGNNNTNDVIGGNNGTLQNGATFAPGKVNQAFSLDGNNDYVDAGDVDLPGTFTIDAWVNPTGFANEPYIFSKARFDTAERSYYLGIEATGTLILFVRTTIGGLTIYRTSNPVITAGTFQHVAVTHDGSAGPGSKIKFYVNGVNVPASVQDDDGGAPINEALSAKIGISGDTVSNAFSGLIDEVELFSTVLTAGEVQGIFNADSIGKCLPPDLTITKTHADPFKTGDVGDTYTITVSNQGGASSGTVTVTDALPAGLTATAWGGTGWTNCTAMPATGPAALSCQRSNTLGANSAYPALTLTVDVANNAPGSVTNTATVSGGGELNTSNDTANDQTNVVAPPTLSKAFGALTIPLGGTTTLTFTITNPNATVGLTGVGFSDTLPAGLQVAAAPGVSNTCGGTFTPAAGNTTLTFSGGSVPGGGNCTLAVNVTGTIAGVKNNTTGTISSNQSNPGATSNTATITVVAPATISKAFGPATIPQNVPTALTFTINNPNATVGLTGVAFSDTLPAGQQVAAAPNVSNTCGGTFVPAAGNTTLTFSGGSVSAGGNCTIAVDITGTTAGVKNNTSGTISSAEGGAGATSNTATITVVAPPTISKQFGTGSLQPNGTTSLTFTLTNPNATVALNGVGFSDTLPAGLVVNTPSGLATTCSGAATAANGSNIISLSGATLTTGSPSCTLSVNVKATGCGTQNNTSGAVTSTNGGTGATANASLDIVCVDLTVTKTHVGNFTQADTGKTYSILVSNIGQSASSGLVTLTDSLPAGLTARSISGGVSWNCTNIPAGGTPGPATLTCTTSDPLAGSGASFPQITLTVDVSCTAAALVTNTATVSGGGDGSPGNNTANDPTTVNPDNTPPVIVCPGSITRFADSGQSGANINPGTPVATDNCGIPTVTGVRSDGKPLNAPYPIGLTLITWTAKDAANNTATCNQTILVMVSSSPRKKPIPEEEEALMVAVNLVVAYFSGVW
jgi:uncharacterized repeat protein (TIGR01451 family)